MKKFESKNLVCVLARLILFFTVFLIVDSSYSQSDTLNKLNSVGKKHGYWKVLLNENIDPVKDISEAVFYGIEQWDDGKFVFKYHKHDWRFAKITYDGKLPQKGKPELITGNFSWFDKSGLLINAESYNNGKPLRICSYSSCAKDKTKTCIFEEIDFTKLYMSIPGTFYFVLHRPDGTIAKKYWFRKGNKGWKSYRIIE